MIPPLFRSYMSTVAAEGEYGEKGIASFVRLAKVNRVAKNLFFDDF